MDQLGPLIELAKHAAEECELADRFSTIEARREPNIAFGRALSAIRKLTKADQEFNQLLINNGLAIRSSAWRSDAMWLAEQVDGLRISVNLCPYTNPTDVRKWFRKQDPNHQPRHRTTTAGQSAAACKVRDYVSPLVENDEPLSVQEVAKATGFSRIVCEVAIAFERGRQAGLAEATEPAAPKDRFEAIERRLRAQLETEIEQRVREEVRLRMEQRDAADIEAIEQANELLSSSTGRLRPPFTPEQYYQILWALHPDNNDTAKLTAAFILMRQKKLLLCEDGPIKRKSSLAAPLPKSAAELLERRRSTSNRHSATARRV